MKLSKWLVSFVVLVCSSVIWAKVNINTASISELESLKGIGTKKAERIIEYREKVGNFKSVEDLINVSGIGPNTLNKIRDEIEIGDDNHSVSSKSNNSDTKKEKIDTKTSLQEEKSSKVEQEGKRTKKSSQSSDKEEKDKSTSSTK